MIIGEQPGHFRFVWNQTQYFGEGNARYVNRSAVAYSGESLLTPTDLGDGWTEATTFHHFQLYAVAGPYVEAGFYRWDTDEAMTQLALRRNWTVLAGPRPATFKLSLAGSSVWNHGFSELRLVTDANRAGWDEPFRLATHTAYTPAAGDEVMLVGVITGAEEIQAYRPLLILPFGPAQTLPAGSGLRLDKVRWWQLAMYYSDPGLWRDDHYRGLN